MLRTLRDLATGARTQLRDELGPEFADVDLRNLNPRTALRSALLGDDGPRRASTPQAVLRDAWATRRRAVDCATPADPRRARRRPPTAAAARRPPTPIEPVTVRQAAPASARSARGEAAPYRPRDAT